MNTFTHEEEKLVLVIAACFLMATAVLLCCPEYGEKVVLSSTSKPADGRTSNETKIFTTGETPVDINRPEFKKSSRETINLSNKLDPNFATYQELVGLPGIGPSTAKSLLSYREKHILFSAEDLTKIKGIGPLKLSKLQDFLVFSAESNSNSARDSSNSTQSGGK